MLVIYERKFSAADNDAMRIDLDGRAVEVYNDVFVPDPVSSGSVDPRTDEMSIWKSTPTVETLGIRCANLYTSYEMFANKSLCFFFGSVSVFCCCCSLVAHVACGHNGSPVENWRMHERTHLYTHHADQLNSGTHFRRTNESLQIIESHLSFVCQTPNK